MQAQCTPNPCFIKPFKVHATLDKQASQHCFHCAPLLLPHAAQPDPPALLTPVLGNLQIPPAQAPGVCPQSYTPDLLLSSQGHVHALQPLQPLPHAPVHPALSLVHVADLHQDDAITKSVSKLQYMKGMDRPPVQGRCGEP